ncbi:MAG: cell division protein ZapA [Alphaproteobacteria bacterium]|nr:cell division protein ZapA [Alphaproteobacteria bacterium]
MSKVNIKLHDREYSVSCDPGEEDRLMEVVAFVDKKMREVSSRSTSAGETRLFMLTCLMLADELSETKRVGEIRRLADEDLMVAAVEHLSQRVAHISSQVGRA